MRQHQKKKRKNTSGRRDKSLSDVVNLITKDALLTLEELTANAPGDAKRDKKDRVIVEKKDLPEGVTTVDTLNGAWAYSDERLLRHVETMKLVLQEFDDEFWNDDGFSIMDLRRDRKGRLWADDLTIMYLCYTAIAMNLALWPYTRREWSALPEGMPFIKFICEKRPTNVKGKPNEQQQNSSPSI